MRVSVALLLAVTVAAPLAEAQAPKPAPAPAAPPAPRSAAPPSHPSSPSAAAAGQGPAPVKPAAPAGQGIAINTDHLVEPPGFTYNLDGRRDPFLSLVRRGVEPRSGGQTRPSGLAGLSVAEVTLRGTVRSREGFVAILQGADQRAYIVRPGDKLFDGLVRTVSPGDVVILQQVNDPLSLEKQREVRKVLRQAEAN